MADKSSAHKQQLMQLDDNNNQGGGSASSSSSSSNQINNNNSPIISHGQQTSVNPATATPTTISIKQQQTMTNSTSSIESTPPSPKAKSAPATPCNITPIAFHQIDHNGGGSHYLNLSPSPANTMPPDIRKNISATCRMLPTSIRQIQSQQQTLISTALNHNSKQPSTSTSNIGTLAQAQQQQHQLNSPKSTPTNGSNTNVINSRHIDDLVKRGEMAFEAKEYKEAIQVFSQCIELAENNLTEKQNITYLKENFKIYSLRAEAHFNLGNYNKAIDDSIAARDLNPKWTQAYYLQGRSQFLLKQFAVSLAVFSFGLAQDPTNKRLLEALVESALKSNFKQEFQQEYESLTAHGYDKTPCVVVAVLGQELLAKGHGEHAAVVLESALKMFNQTTALDSSSNNNNSSNDNAKIKKFKGSVLSTLALAYCMMKDYEKAINYMQKELEIETELEDVAGQCRVLFNLGHAYFKLRKFDKSLEVHRSQLHLAMKNHLFQQASIALNALGHVHSARLDYANALTSHTRCLDILKQLGDNYFSQFKEVLSIGHIHSQLNDFKAAEEKYNEARTLLNQASKSITTTTKSTNGQEELTVGLILLKFNTAYLAMKKQCYQDAVALYEDIIQYTGRISSPRRILYEMRAANGMGQAHRLSKNFDEARNWFEKQLQLSKQLQSDHHQFSDEVGQSQALSNLAMTCQHFKDYPSACRLFDENMRLAEENRNPLLKAYAHSYLASMFFLQGRYNEAQTHYESSSNLFKELQYCSSERKTIDLNMALVYEKMGGVYSNSELQLQQSQQQPQATPAGQHQTPQQQPINTESSVTSQLQLMSIDSNNTSPLVISNNSINLTPTTNNSNNNNGSSTTTNAPTVNNTSVQINAAPQAQATQKKVMMAA